MDIKKYILSRIQNRNLQIFLYAVLTDALVLLFLGLVGLMTFEALIPGIISLRFNLGILIFVTAMIFFFLAWLGHHVSLSFSHTEKSWHFLVTVFLIWSFLLIANSLLKFPLLALLVILISTGIIGILFYQVLFSVEEKT